MANAARLRAIRRKFPPQFNVFFTLLQPAASSNKKIRTRTAGACTRPVNSLYLLGAAVNEIERFWNYSFRMLPNRRILASNEWSDAAVGAAVLEVGL